MIDDELKPGDEVIRGPNWIWGDQDGGPGTIGKIIKFDDEMPPEECWYIVEWPNGDKDGYVYKKDGKRQIQRFKPIDPIRVKQPKEEIEVKIKRMDKSEFKRVLKEFK